MLDITPLLCINYYSLHYHHCSALAPLLKGGSAGTTMVAISFSLMIWAHYYKGIKCNHKTVSKEKDMTCPNKDDAHVAKGLAQVLDIC